MKTLLKCTFIFSMMVMLIAEASAKKIICVATNSSVADPTFLNNHEGWERQNMKPGDVIQVGGSLTDCMAQLQDSDTLVIVTHGSENGGFEWDGEGYDGFGDGEGEYPLPPNMNQKKIHIKFCACYSARDPDGTGDDKPIKEKLKDKCEPGSTAEGFPDVSRAKSCFRVTPGPTTTQAQVDAVKKKLEKNQSWSALPPFNRSPEPVPSDRSHAQAIADSLGFGVTITITYKQPVNATTQAPGSGGFVIGCTCSDFGCGQVEIIPDETVHTDAVPMNNFTLFPNGVHRMREDLVLSPNVPGHPYVVIRNLRAFGFAQQYPVPLPGQFLEFNTPVQVALQVSYDLGQSWVEVIAGGFMQGSVAAIVLDSPDVFMDLTVNQFFVNVVSPDILFENTFVLMKEEAYPATGVLSYRPDMTGFMVDSYFDITCRADFMVGTSAAACGPSTIVLECSSIGTGCTNPEAQNFEPCSIFDNGGCIIPHAGCTYAGAINYDPTANSDNGTCLFIGCTDPTAYNYDPMANHDNGSCNFSPPCPTDLTNDGFTNTGDLLVFLAEFGQPCD